MSTARERFRSLRGTSRKKSIFGEFRILMVVIVAAGLVLVFSMPRVETRKLMTSAFSKRNHGIILDYFPMTQEGVVTVLGEPDSSTPYRKNEQLLYWKFDPVTLEIHFRKDQVSRIAYAINKEIIRDHIEGRALKVYGREEDWKRGIRLIDGENKIVYLNERSRMTVVKYDKSVMVYNYLFPEPVKKSLPGN